MELKTDPRIFEQLHALLEERDKITSEIRKLRREIRKCLKEFATKVD